MKISLRARKKLAGNVLLISLGVAGVLGTSLAGYLTMAASQNKSVVRSQHWNASLPLAEAGIEEALQVINKYAGHPDPFMLTNWVNTVVSQDKWTQSGSTYYVWRYVDGAWYYTSVTATANPTIRSIGYVLWNDPDRYSSWMTRELQVRTRFDPLWNVAMAAKEVIDFSGNNVETDSFDSSDPAFSGVGGLYDASKRKAGGDVCTDLAIINSLSVGNAKIRGRAKTGPLGTISIGPNGSVGSLGWVASNKGIEPGWSADDMNVVFPNVKMPSGSWLAPTSSQMDQTVGGKTYQYVFLNSGDYEVSGVTGSVLVDSNAIIRLKVTGNIALTGGDEFRLSSGAVQVYMQGSSTDLGGNGLINSTGLAQNFLYFGMPSNTSVKFFGNAGIAAAIYAPQAHFELKGGGSSTWDFIGASVTKTVKMSGHFNFHYDEALRKVGPGRGFMPTNWREL